VTLTPEGRSFCEKEVTPALKAEQRAFESLSPKDRTALVALIRRYVVAIDVEAHALHAEGTAEKELTDNTQGGWS